MSGVPASASDLARFGIDRWQSGDFEAVYASWHPDIRFRPDVNFPDAGELNNQQARRFVEDQQQFMGNGLLAVVEEHDLGERCLLRIRQQVDAPASGVRSSYEWSVLATAREGKLVRVEFFIDRTEALRAAGVAGPDG